MLKQKLLTSSLGFPVYISIPSTKRITNSSFREYKEIIKCKILDGRGCEGMSSMSWQIKGNTMSKVKASRATWKVKWGGRVQTDWSCPERE